MATTTISGSTIRNNGGVAVGVTTSTSTLSALTLRNTAGNHNLIGTESKAFPYNGVEYSLRGSAVAITGITQYLSTGKCKIQKSSHGKSVGDKVIVTGADVAGYNRVHTVTVVVDANNFATDVNYSAATSTHGNYYAVSGNFNKMTAGKYVARIICTEIAGISNSLLKSGASGSGGTPYFAVARGNRRYNITSVNVLTGAVTKGANAGDAFTYHDIAGNTTLAKEAFRTRAIPGRITYQVKGTTATVSSTPAITG